MRYLALFALGTVFNCAVRYVETPSIGAGYCGTAEACGRACAGGDAHACGYIAEAELVGANVPRNVEHSVIHATTGCDGNDGRSCQLLAAMHFAGAGMAKDAATADFFADKGCRLGWAISCSFLGVSYRDGLGVPQDADRATALFGQSCDGGSAEGCVHLALGSPDGMVPDDRAANALAHLVHECDPHVNSDARVCRVAAKMFANGRGTQADTERAKVLYDAACKRGDTEACDHHAP